MANDSTPPPAPRSGLSLYANLLDPSSSTPGSITSAPVTYSRPPEATPEQDEAAKKQQALAASLRFQPTKRPQVAAQKAKAKAIASKLSALPPTTSIAAVTAAESTQPLQQESIGQPSLVPKSTIADWTATASDDEDIIYNREKRTRGGRKKRKKNKDTVEVVQDWDDIYDPSRPNNYEEYKHSEEKIREVQEWKDLLYRHKMKRRDSSDYDSDRSDERPQMNRQFAPPMSFAPPSNLNDENYTPPPPPPPADIPDDPTGEDAYARRMRLSQNQPPPPAIPSHPPTDVPPPPPPPGQISRAPVRYSLPDPPSDIPASEEELQSRLADSPPPPPEDTDTTDQPRSNRPGQAGFAERLMSKYGWSKGQGLGAQGTGIINPLYAKVDKRKKKSDAEGGGYATPAGTGKIMGGDKSKASGATEAEGGKFGAMSEVIRLENMLNGLDLDEEMNGEGGSIMQEIGEECSEKYGTVERVYIDRRTDEEGGARVFVKFVSQLSALRAVNALEGRIFNGNAITARFWDVERFEKGEYV